METVGAHSDHAWWIINAIEDGDIVGGTSEITFAEILVKPLERGTHDLVEAYEQMIVAGANFELSPITLDILKDAARLRTQHRSLRLPDAVHVATAQRLSCTFFVTEDRRIRLPQNMKRMPVGPFALDDILAR
jgi:predicted nucleic acid-binding protein